MWTLIFWCILGVSLGSFLNVIAMRSVDGRDWVKGHSECDNCKHKLSVIDLIPVFGYLINKGKCKYCGTSISLNHILSELGFMLIFAFLKPDFILAIVLCVLWINLCSDIMYKVTITSINYFGIFTILILNIIKYDFNIDILIGIISIGIVLVLNFIFKNKDSKFGLGDLDILLLLTVYYNWYFSIQSLMIGCVIGVCVFIPLLLVHKIDRKTQIPLVPFIFLGFLIGVIF